MKESNVIAFYDDADGMEMVITQKILSNLMINN